VHPSEHDDPELDLPSEKGIKKEEGELGKLMDETIEV